MKVLVGEISSYKAIVIVKYLRVWYPNIEVYTYDNQSFTHYIKTGHSNRLNHYVLDNKSVDSYLDALAELVHDMDIDFFVPVHSNYIGDILKKKDQFGSSLSYLGDFQTYRQLHVKDKLQSLAHALGIEVPCNYDTIADAELPFVAKPVEGSSSQGVVYFRDTKPVKSLGQNYIYQEFIEGFGCGYSVYAKNGKIQVGYGHRRLAEYPVKGGSSVYRTGFYVDEMRNAARKILKQTGWTGFCMFEFKYTQTQRLVLIEVNPRVWGSINQGLQNGANYVESFLGQPSQKRNLSDEINTYLTPQIYLVLIQYLLRGNTQPMWSFIKKSKGINKADISMYRDFKGWLSVILRSFLK